MAAFLGVADIAILTATLAISLAIIVPIYGIVVRIRSNFNPKALQLDNEGGAQAHTGPVIKTLYAMTRRVYRLEGISGFYKGLMPTLTTSLTLTFFLILFGVKKGHRGRYNAHHTNVLLNLVLRLFALIFLPVTIITVRSITTPYKLPYFRPFHSLRTLLTPTERRKPWKLYLTPGLLAAEVFHISWVVLVLHPILNLHFFRNVTNAPLRRLTPLVGVVLVSAAVLTPLEVITMRLMNQRNHASPEHNSVSREGEGETEEELTQYAGATEDVIGLRNEADPYLGLADCATKIITEEGWEALYRAWWLTALGIFLSAL